MQSHSSALIRAAVRPLMAALIACGALAAVALPAASPAGQLGRALAQAGATATSTATPLPEPTATTCGSSPLQGRTQKVVDAIVAEVPGITDCASVTAAHLAAITTLSIADQSLTSLQSGDFAGLTALQDLALRHNQLTTLPAGLFAGLTALQELALSNNRLSTLPVGLFTGLTNLRVLYLGNNRLSTLPAGLFTGLTSLGLLFMDNNQLSTLPVGLFTGLTSLVSLSLINNRLTTLPAGLFTGLTSLGSLSLINNRLTTLPASLFTGLTNLHGLYLNGNQLSTLPVGLFTGLTSLDWLSLRNNRLATLPTDLFAGLTSLQVLSLTGNQLGNVAPAYFNYAAGSQLGALTTLNLGTARQATAAELAQYRAVGLTALTDLYMTSATTLSVPPTPAPTATPTAIPTPTATPRPATFGGYWALAFDGWNDYVRVPGIGLANRSFSIAGWVAPDRFHSGRLIWFAARASGNQRLLLEVLRSGQAVVEFAAGSLHADPGLVQFGAWNHLVVTYDQPSNTARLYVNGVARVRGQPGPFTGRSPTIELGRRVPWHFKGELDEVRVYRKALSASEVQAHYNAGHGVRGEPEPDLLAGWHFDEGQGRTAYDYSGHNRHGTLVNGPRWVRSDVARARPTWTPLATATATATPTPQVITGENVLDPNRSGPNEPRFPWFRDDGQWHVFARLTIPNPQGSFVLRWSYNGAWQGSPPVTANLRILTGEQVLSSFLHTGRQIGEHETRSGSLMVTPPVGSSITYVIEGQGPRGGFAEDFVFTATG